MTTVVLTDLTIYTKRASWPWACRSQYDYTNILHISGMVDMVISAMHGGVYDMQCRHGGHGYLCLFVLMVDMVISACIIYPPMHTLCIWWTWLSLPVRTPAAASCTIGVRTRLRLGLARR